MSPAAELNADRSPTDLDQLVAPARAIAARCVEERRVRLAADAGEVRPGARHQAGPVDRIHMPILAGRKRLQALPREDHALIVAHVRDVDAQNLRSRQAAMIAPEGRPNLILGNQSVEVRIGELAEDPDSHPRVLAPIFGDLAAGVLERDARRPHRVVRVGRDGDRRPARGIAGAIEQPRPRCRVAGDRDMRLARVAGEDGLADREHAHREIARLIEQPHDVGRVQAGQGVADLLLIGRSRPFARLHAPCLGRCRRDNALLGLAKHILKQPAFGLPACELGPQAGLEVVGVDRGAADHAVGAGQREMPADPRKQRRFPRPRARLHGQERAFQIVPQRARLPGVGLDAELLADECNGIVVIPSDRVAE